MNLDISENSWEMFCSILQKAKIAGTIWHSPKQQKPYRVFDVLPHKIIIQREDGENSELGKRGYLYFLNHFNNNNGIYNRKDYNGHVAKMSAIVYFHPLLQWIENNDFIKVNAAATKGFFKYQDYGNPPNDDIEELQIFARKVRRGQPAFKNALLKNYSNKCCITGCEILEVLDACHIEPHSQSGINQVDNGLLLRTDIHSLFDANLLFISPKDYSIHLDKSLRNSEYKNLHGKIIKGKTLPKKEYLIARWEHKKW
ncbi:MAG: HNH endonuclease [Chitinophagales bacterium]|nr:HNH endonuclease [Chitinophagales bacterium]